MKGARLPSWAVLLPRQSVTPAPLFESQDPRSAPSAVTPQAFASRASIVHIDIDPAEIGKNKQPSVSVCADVKPALALLNSMIKDEIREGHPLPDYSQWWKEVMDQKAQWPLKYPQVGLVLCPDMASYLPPCVASTTPPGVALHCLQVPPGEALLLQLWKDVIGQKAQWPLISPRAWPFLS